jgi:hypothetical protein
LLVDPPAGETPRNFQVRDLVRRFGTFTAVDHVSFDVRPGEIFGLLGPNGAAKTSTFRMLCGLLAATSGTLRVAGVDVRGTRASARQRIGYVAQKFSLYGQLSVRENEANDSHYFLVPGLVVLVMTLIGAMLTAMVMAREWDRAHWKPCSSRRCKPVRSCSARLDLWIRGDVRPEHCGVQRLLQPRAPPARLSGPGHHPNMVQPQPGNALAHDSELGRHADNAPDAAPDRDVGRA